MTLKIDSVVVPSSKRDHAVFGESVRKVCFALVALLALTLVPRYVSAQENPKPDGKKPASTLKVQVIFAEQVGEKKMANLPYTFFLKAANAGPVPPSWTKVRMGSKLPVHTGKEEMQYIDVGTNIDARGFAVDDGRFEINLALERSWVEGEVLIAKEKGAGRAGDANSENFNEPIIRQFKTELTLTMHDGETIQTTQAADPLSGRVLTVTVILNVMK